MSVSDTGNPPSSIYKLPFGRNGISSIKWAPGDKSCLLTYRDQVTRAVRTMKVELSEMEGARPNFRRLLACAAVIARSSRTKHKKTADLIYLWEHLLQMNKHRPVIDVLFDNDDLINCSDVTVFSFGLKAVSYSLRYRRPHERECLLRWKNGKEYAVDPAVYDANFPGFTDYCTILCVENEVQDGLAFQLLGRMVARLPYAILEANVIGFSSHIRACLSVGMALNATFETLIVNALALPKDERCLPELSTTMTF
jgi:hypothetical protein